MAVLTAVAGNASTPVDRDAPRKGDCTMPEKALVEKIIKSPEIPLPFDKPPKVRRNSFEFLGLSKSYKPSKYFDFKLRTPDWWEPAGKMGYSYVVIGAKDDYDKTSGRPSRLRDKRI